MRPYKWATEQGLADRLVARALSGENDKLERYECLGGINLSSGVLLDYRTDLSKNSLALGKDIDAHIKNAGKIIVHHNHIGLHSLSGDDWAGMVKNPGIAENWVHCWDGTRYFGRVVPGHEDEILRFCDGGPESAHANAVNSETHALMGNPSISDTRFNIFRNEIGPHLVNLRMLTRGLVEYEADFGDYLKPLVEEVRRLQGS
jgi:hypothetical protein